MDANLLEAPVKTKTNGMAITSIVFSGLAWLIFLMGLCFNFLILPLFAVLTLGIGSVLALCWLPVSCLSPIGWLVGVISGHVANNQIKETGDAGSGLAKAGLISGYVGLGLLLISICVITGLVASGASVPLIDEIFRNLNIQ